MTSVLSGLGRSHDTRAGETNQRELTFLTFTLAASIVDDGASDAQGSTINVHNQQEIVAQCEFSQ